MTDTSTLGRRERKKRAMRANILATATRLFSEQGYHETTVGQIADELDISSATFFNYFGSKDAIIEELAEEVVAELEALLEKMATAPIGTAGVVRAHFGSNGSGLRPKRNISRSLSVEILRVVLASPESPKVLERMERSIAKVLTHSQRLGEMRSDLQPEQVARAAAHLTIGAVTAWLMSPKEPLERRISESLSFLLGAIGTKQEVPMAPRRARPAR